MFRGVNLQKYREKSHKEYAVSFYGNIIYFLRTTQNPIEFYCRFSSRFFSSGYSFPNQCIYVFSSSVYHMEIQEITFTCENYDSSDVDKAISEGM